MRILNDSTGEVEEHDSDSGIDLIWSGSHSVIPSEKYQISDQDTGTVEDVDGLKAKELIESGKYFFYRPEPSEQMGQKLTDIQELGQKRAMDDIINFGSSALYGLPEQAARLLPKDQEEAVKERFREARESEDAGGARLAGELLSPIDWALGGPLLKGAAAITKGAKALSKTPSLKKGIELGIGAAGIEGARSGFESMSDAYIYDQDLTADALTSDVIGGAARGGIAGTILGTALDKGIRATTKVGKEAANKIKGQVGRAEKQTNETLQDFVTDFSRADSLPKEAVEASESVVKVLKKEPVGTTGRKGVKVVYDTNLNEWVYKDDNRLVTFNKDQFDINSSEKEILTILSKETLADEAIADGLRLSRGDKLLNQELIDQGKIHKAVGEVYILNIDPTDEIAVLNRTRNLVANAAGSELKAWRVARDAFFLDIDKNGFLPRHIKQKENLIKNFESIQNKIQGMPYAGVKRIKKTPIRKAIDETVESFDGYKIKDNYFIIRDDSIAKTMQSSTKNYSAKAIKSIPEWQRKLIRWAGGGRIATFKNKTPEQLSDAAKFIGQSGKYTGDFKELQMRAKSTIASSNAAMNDAVVAAENNAISQGLEIGVQSDEIANMFRSEKMKYVHKQSGKVYPDSKGTYDFLEKLENEWRSFVDEFGEPIVLDLADARKRRAAIDDMVKVWNKENGKSQAVEMGAKSVRSKLEERIMEEIAKYNPQGHADILGIYKNAKKEYGTAKLVDEIVTNEANAALARNDVPLSAYASMIGGATIGGFAGSPLLLAGAGVAARTMYKNQGDYFVGKMLQKINERANGKVKKMDSALVKFFKGTPDKMALKASTMAAIGEYSSPREAYEKEKARIKKMVENAKTIENEELLQFSEDEFYNKILERLDSSTNYLIEKFPDIAENIDDPDWAPASTEMFSYLRYKEALINSDSIFTDFSNLTINKEQVEVLKEVYPSMHAYMYLKAVEMMEGKRLNQDQKQVLSKTFGIQTDRINSTNMMKFRAPAQQPEPEGRTRKVGSGQKLSGQQPSRTDRITER